MRHRRNAIWAGVVAATLAGTTLMTGCGAGATKKTAGAVSHADAVRAVLSRAADRSERLGSAEVKMTMDMGPGSTPATMTGTYSWRGGYAFDVVTAAEAVDMRKLTASATVRMMFVDGSYYYDVDPQPSGPLKGKEWMKVDGPAMFGEKGSAKFSGYHGGSSPTASLQALRYATDVKDLGRASVNGRSATHYATVLDRAHKGRLEEAFGSENALLGAFFVMADSITTDVWVDAEGLPVRLEQNIGSMRVTMDFAKFGATAGVEAPPAARTGDMTEELRATARQQS
ncbi:hypothetical protein [Streptomyces olivochromogenes]|uniref:Putative lipoprotein n=1 Tax=Streptomyces olivochromogenes TaxID=1963 RepID=A0A250V833_STROL|nr:hypothetical protein [Streptomyces olivochromogenes]KUN45766.1 hypothetical protein AQJ27_19925 [Streptomyces olivochromogenes]GAX50321.1 putative lipoprotein [Streptomyces olivochromogenes]